MFHKSTQLYCFFFLRNTEQSCRKCWECESTAPISVADCLCRVPCDVATGVDRSVTNLRTMGCATRSSRFFASLSIQISGKESQGEQRSIPVFYKANVQEISEHSFPTAHQFTKNKRRPGLNTLVACHLPDVLTSFTGGRSAVASALEKVRHGTRGQTLPPARKNRQLAASDIRFQWIERSRRGRRRDGRPRGEWRRATTRQRRGGRGGPCGGGKANSQEGAISFPIATLARVTAFVPHYLQGKV